MAADMDVASMADTAVAFYDGFGRGLYGGFGGFYPGYYGYGYFPYCYYCY